MRHFLLVVRACLGVAMLVMMTGSAWAQSPTYLVLRAPAQHTSHHHSSGYFPGQRQNVTTQAYSYGWFGVAPRQHPQRSFGYYRNYTQWRHQ